MVTRRWALSLNDFGQLAIADPKLAMVIVRVKRRHLTYLSYPALLDLANEVRRLDENQTPGLILECGTALGGSAIVMTWAKKKARSMRIYDTFGMIPSPTQADGPDVHARYEEIRSGTAVGIGDSIYYGYRNDLLSEVTRAFALHGVPIEMNSVQLVQGLFQETLEITEPVALAHLDGDWYESTITCLERITPYLVNTGRLVVDDYADWSGCQRAVDDYFRRRHGYRFEYRNRLHIIKL